MNDEPKCCSCGEPIHRGDVTRYGYGGRSHLESHCVYLLKGRITAMEARSRSLWNEAIDEAVKTIVGRSLGRVATASEIAEAVRALKRPS